MQLAQAEAQAREMTARGEKAQALVPVEIARENCSMSSRRVWMSSVKQLENRQEFAEAGIRLEIEKLRIQADKEVQQEFARALASFLSHGNMTLYGTPETAQKMMDNMAKGFGIRAMADGFLSGANGSNGQLAGSSPTDALIHSLGSLVGPALEKLTGQSGATPAQADAVARALAANPAAMQAIADALTEGTKSEVVKADPIKRDGAKPVVVGNGAGNK